MRSACSHLSYAHSRQGTHVLWPWHKRLPTTGFLDECIIASHPTKPQLSGPRPAPNKHSSKDRQRQSVHRSTGNLHNLFAGKVYDLLWRPGIDFTANANCLLTMKKSMVEGTLP